MFSLMKGIVLDKSNKLIALAKPNRPPYIAPTRKQH